MSRSYSATAPAQLPQARPYSFFEAGCVCCRKSNMAKPTVEQIRQRAQEIWIENHRPEGRDDEFWYQAEKELDEKELGDIAKETPPTILPG